MPKYVGLKERERRTRDRRVTQLVGEQQRAEQAAASVEQSHQRVITLGLHCPDCVRLLRVRPRTSQDARCRSCRRALLPPRSVRRAAIRRATERERAREAGELGDGYSKPPVWAFG